ncbi:MAG: lipid-A-disaccharide synthase N-terminal domain-containing protein [Gammaproteobacteria bacterium]|nr:lipid-A-disaccharide synthase N-terminal domain-containing protein [Gammaproteobacteria bacterium]
MTTDTVWVAIGLLGQALFAGRFLVQWLASERTGRSIVPLGFWYLSIGGSAILLAYALHRHDVVFTLGQLFGFVVYGRNLSLIRRERRRLAAGGAPDGTA